MYIQLEISPELFLAPKMSGDNVFILNLICFEDKITCLFSFTVLFECASFPEKKNIIIVTLKSEFGVFQVAAIANKEADGKDWFWRNQLAKCYFRFFSF